MISINYRAAYISKHDRVDRFIIWKTSGCNIIATDNQLLYTRNFHGTNLAPSDHSKALELMLSGLIL
jgi:hypothetical protein